MESDRIKAPEDRSAEAVGPKPDREGSRQALRLQSLLITFTLLVLGCLVAYAIGIEGLKHAGVARWLPEAEGQFELSVHRLTVGLGAIFALMTVMLLLGAVFRVLRGRPVMARQGPLR